MGVVRSFQHPIANTADEHQRRLAGRAFQLGVSGLLGFKNTLAMIEAGKYQDAANSMLQSKWATQTPARAKRLSNQILAGVWQ